MQEKKQGETMEKDWYKSKAIWGGLLVIFGGVITAIGQFLNGTIDASSLITQIVPIVGTGLGIVGIRTAQK